MKQGDYVEIAVGGKRPAAYGRFISTDNETTPESLSTRVWVFICESVSVLMPNHGQRVSLPLSACQRVIPEDCIPEWRCTRPGVYGPGTPGHKEKNARQGHYIKAMTVIGAEQAMRREFPQDKAFDVEPWKRVSWSRVGTGKNARLRLLRAMFIEEAKQLLIGDHVFLRMAGNVYSVKVNGAPKTWKTRPQEVRIPYRYGIHKFGEINHTNVLGGQVYVEVEL